MCCYGIGESGCDVSIPFLFRLCYFIFVIASTPRARREAPMEWVTPQHEEIDLNCEISSYANAEL